MEFDLNKALSAINARNTDEMREEQEKQSQEVRNALVSPSNSADIRISRAREQEKGILANIALLASEPESELKQNRLFVALNRLSELLAEQGKYTEAAEVCPEEIRRAIYLNVQAAIVRPDSDVCDCAPDAYQSNGRMMESKAELKTADVIANGEIKSLYQCRKCGSMNAR